MRRIWCVGRNYLEHIREIGNDERQPPFFFAKHADMVVPDGGNHPLPAADEGSASRGRTGRRAEERRRQHRSGQGARSCVWGYGVGIDLTRRDLQIASRKKERPWEIGKSFDQSAPISALRPASEIGHPAKARIWLKANGELRQDGDLEQMIWNTAEIISKLSQQVSVGAGDIIMTGTPAGVAQIVEGDKLECGIDGIGTLKCTIS